MSKCKETRITSETKTVRVVMRRDLTSKGYGFRQKKLQASVGFTMIQRIVHENVEIDKGKEASRH